MTESIRRAMWVIRPLYRPPGIDRPRAGRREGLADVQPRRPRHAATTRARRPSAGTMPAGSRRSGGSPPRARARRSGSSTPRPSSWTATSTSARPRDPTFYKLTPDGKVRWSYRNPARADGPRPTRAKGRRGRRDGFRFQSSAEGASSARRWSPRTPSTSATWGAGSTRSTGRPAQERWKLSTRGKEFPGAHPINVFFASPILADGKLIVAGGTLEQVVAACPVYQGLHGPGIRRGPRAEDRPGRLEVRRRAQARAARPADHDQGQLRRPHLLLRAGDELGLVHALVRRGVGHDLLRHRRQHRAAAADRRRPAAAHARVVRGRRAGRPTTGTEKWVTQINPGDVWTNAMRSYDPKEGRYKDQSIGDTPKIYTIAVEGKPTRVVGVGCKNGGFYVLRADDGRIVDHTPALYRPAVVSALARRRTGGCSPCRAASAALQTGCATDGRTIFTNGIDALRLGSQEKPARQRPCRRRAGAWWPSASTRKTERWRHERPRVASLGGPPPKPVFTDVGDPVASGIAVANGVVYFTAVASGKLVALDAATGAVLKEIDLGPVWSGPSVSRGRVYVGTGNTLFTPDGEAFFPKDTGVLLLRPAGRGRSQSPGRGRSAVASDLPVEIVRADMTTIGSSSVRHPA